MGVKFFTRALPSPVSRLCGALGLSKGFTAVLEQLLYSRCWIQGSRSVPGQTPPPDLLVWVVVVALVMAAAEINSGLWLCNASNVPCFTG